MKRYSEILKNTKLFMGMTDSEIDSVLLCMSALKHDFQKGEYIFRIGEKATMIALLISGSIHIQREDYWGNLSILSKVSTGELFGEPYAVINNETVTNNAIAVEQSTVLFLNINHFFTVCPHACNAHSKLIQNFVSVMALENRRLALKLEHMSQRTTREKLLSYLSEQSVKAGNSSFNIPFNRQQLADFLSVDRSAMSNELCKMRNEGILDFKKNHFVLK